MKKLTIGIIAASLGLTASAYAQFTNGTATLDVSVDSDVILLFPVQAPGKLTGSGTITIQRSNATGSGADLMVTDLNVTGQIDVTGVGIAPMTMVADFTDATRSNNAGVMSGAGFPASSRFDLYFSITGTLPGVGTVTAYSSLNQDNGGPKAMPAHMAGTANDVCGTGNYAIELAGPGQNGNPDGTGMLFATQGANGTGISVLQFIGMTMTLSNCQDLGNENKIVAAFSSRLHGATGVFELPLLLDSGPTRESRQPGGSPAMVIEFEAPPAAIDGTLDCSEVTVTNGTCVNVVPDGNRMIVNLNGLAKNTCLTVQVSGIDAMTGIDTVATVLQEGNVDGNPAVNILDLQAIKNALLDPVDGSNFELDVNVSGGTINILDLQTAKNNLFGPAGCL